MGDIDLKMISAAENSNKNPKNQVLEGKSVEDEVTLGPTAQATLVTKWNIKNFLGLLVQSQMNL